MLWGLLMQLYVEWKSLVLKRKFQTGLMRCCGFSRHMHCQLACMPVRFGLRDFWSMTMVLQPLQVAHMAFLRRILGTNYTSANWCVLQECAQEPLQFYWCRSAVKFWNRIVDSNSNTLRDVMKADISLGNSGASNCWTRQMKDAFGDLQNGTVYIQKWLISMLVGWAAREEREELFLGVCMRPLFSLLLRCSCSLGTPGFVRLSQPLVSCFWLGFLYTHILRHIDSFVLVLLLYTLFSSSYISFLCFFCLARCSFRLFPNFRWDALWGIYSDVTLPYLISMQEAEYF